MARFQTGAGIWVLMMMTVAAALGHTVDAKWRTYGGCRVIPDARNDGDTAHVKTRSRRYLVDLYYVDAPEVDFSRPELVGEQAGYWGVTEDEVVRFGKIAAEFMEKFGDDGVTFFSRREDSGGAGDPPRVLGILKAGDLFLSEALVMRGLARIEGPAPDLPDGTPGTQYVSRLKKLQRIAQRDRAGLWGAKKGRRRMFKAPQVEPREMVLFKRLAVYTPDAEMRYLTHLPEGARVTVLRAESATTLVVEVPTREGPREVRCYVRDFGAKPAPKDDDMP